MAAQSYSRVPTRMSWGYPRAIVAAGHLAIVAPAYQEERKTLAGDSVHLHIRAARKTLAQSRDLAGDCFALLQETVIIRTGFRRVQGLRPAILSPRWLPGV